MRRLPGGILRGKPRSTNLPAMPARHVRERHGELFLRQVPCWDVRRADKRHWLASRVRRVRPRSLQRRAGRHCVRNLPRRVVLAGNRRHRVRTGTCWAFPNYKHCLMPCMECSCASLTTTIRAPEDKTACSLYENRPAQDGRD